MWLENKKSSIKTKQLCSFIAQTLINKEQMDNERLRKLASDAKLELADIKACVALVEFVLKSATKYNVNSETLATELQQLGLPKGKNRFYSLFNIICWLFFVLKRLFFHCFSNMLTISEHSTSLCRVYDDNQYKLEELLRSTSLRRTCLISYFILLLFSFSSLYMNSSEHAR